MSEVGNIIRFAVENGCTKKHLVQLLALDMSMTTRADYEWSKKFVEFALELRELQLEIERGR